MPRHALSFLLSVLVVCFARTACAQTEELHDRVVPPEMLEHGVVLVVEDKSGLANDNTPIHFAGNINGWNPSDEQWVLTHRADGRWQIIIEQPPKGTIMEFKFTLGSWQSEELDGSGQPISNRMLDLIDPTSVAPGKPAQIDLVVVEFRPPVDVPEWGVYPDYHPEEQWTGRVEQFSVVGGAGRAREIERDVFVWLPDEYDKVDDKAYPVLYLMDGQNIFASPPGVPGEWHADEAAAGLIAGGKMEPVIIVGVSNSGMYRADEYLPYGDIEGVRPRGGEFVDWLIASVMPEVESRFNVRTDAAHTAIGGASLGATIALYAATEHPEKFSKVLAESLPLLDEHGDAPRAWLETVKDWPERIVVGMGGHEVSSASGEFPRNKLYTAWAREIDKRLNDAGIDDSHRMLVIDREAAHNEAAWAKRLPGALEFLFPAKP